jgi:hypothetical protein
MLHGSRRGGREGHRIRGRWALLVSEDAGVGEEDTEVESVHAGVGEGAVTCHGGSHGRASG